LCLNPLHVSGVKRPSSGNTKLSALADVPTGLRATGHTAPYQATGPTPTPPSPINQSTHNLQQSNSYKCTQLTTKTASVVPPEDGRLTLKIRFLKWRYSCNRVFSMLQEGSYEDQCKTAACTIGLSMYAYVGKGTLKVCGKLTI
jgi:hypothetical protein